MASFPSINKNQVGILITLMVLIFLGAFYFFVYIPGNEKIVQERRFHCLQNIDNNIHTQIDNNISQIRSLLKAYPNKALFEKYAAAHSQKNFTLMYDEQPTLSTSATEMNISANIKVHVDPNSGEITMSADRLTKKGDPIPSATISTVSKLEHFIKSLLPSDVFDNYILFVNDKKLYETFRSGLSYDKKDSLLQIKNGITSPGIRSLNIGGTDYKVFLQPININNDNRWIVAGLVSNKTYLKERNQLPLPLVLLLLTIAITLIVSLPWIKLYHMGNKDKLTLKDGIASVLVSMVLMSLLFFVFFKYSVSFSSQGFSYLKNKYSRDAFPRNVLATKITNAFEGELQAAAKLLDNCDALDTLEGTDLRDVGTKGTFYDQLLRSGPQHIALQEVFWLDDKGNIINNWMTNTAKTDSGINFSERAYFINTIADRPNKTDSPRLYLDQIISRTTGIFTSVIAQKARDGNGAVAAMSFTLKSLDSVVMPDGYQFAIIDNKGKVLYHYLQSRNLTENLKNEFADSSELVSSIEAKSDTSFAADYFGRQYIIKIKPFDNLPYYTLIFEDLDYNNLRDTEAYIFTLSMLFFLVIFLMIQFMVVFCVSSKRSLFKKQFFDTSWIGPKTTSHQQYNLAILANVIMIVLLVIFFSLRSFLEYVYILLFSITFISIFLNSVFAWKYRNRKYKRHFKTRAIYSLVAFVVLIDLAAVNTLEPKHLYSLLLYELLLTAISAALFYWGPYLLIRISKFLKASSWSYTQSFALMVTTRLIITSGIPAAFFFIYSFNYEQGLNTRYKQLKFAENLDQKISFPQGSDRKKDNSRLDSILSGKLYTAGVYNDGLSIKKVDEVNRDTVNKRHGVYDKEDLLTSEILSYLRFRLNNLALKDNNMIFPAMDSTVFFNNLTAERQGINKASTRTIFKIDKNKYLRLTSSNINYPYPKLFFVYLFFAIIIFYLVIHNIIRKLFALNLPSTRGWKRMDEQLKLDGELNRLLFIIGSPGSGKLSKLKRQINDGLLYGNDNELLVFNNKDQSKNNVFIADMMLIPPENAEDDPDWKKCREEVLNNYSLVVLNHFEYNIKDVKTNGIKLHLLELLMNREKSKIVIISTVHPISFLDSYNQEQCNPMPEHELERWHAMLGHFHIVVEPLESSTIHHHDTLQRIIMEETQRTHFLKKMQPLTLANLPQRFDTKDVGPISDSIVFKLHLTSQYFYTYIWQSLTKEEKFLLYDLAEDGLVNPYDDFNLTILICKGLIIKPKGTLMLFNRGFRNFILTAIGETEVKRIKDQVRDNGSWSNLKVPITMAILAVLVFLFASQQEAYSRLITYITAFGAGVPTVLKIFSMFGTTTQKTA